MIKYPSFLVVVLMIFTAGSLYQVKHFITKKEIELAETDKAIKTTRSDLHILKAELSYLKRPDRLEQIAKNKLNMNYIRWILLFLYHVQCTSLDPDQLP